MGVDEIKYTEDVESSDESQPEDYLMSIEENTEEEELIIRKPNVSKPSYFAPKKRDYTSGYYSNTNMVKECDIDFDEEIPEPDVVPIPL